VSGYLNGLGAPNILSNSTFTPSGCGTFDPGSFAGGAISGSIVGALAYAALPPICASIMAAGRGAYNYFNRPTPPPIIPMHQIASRDVLPAL
jgi:hypothetical protein